MRKLSAQGIWILAILTAAFAAGCGAEQAPGFAPPAVVAVSPLNGATHVPITQVIGATFNEPMDPATINTSTFTLTGPGGVAVNGVVAFSQTTATFTPTLPLSPVTPYNAMITLGALDPNGRKLAAAYPWTFTTSTIPTVVATIPLPGATNVPLNLHLLATFSESMNPATITAPGTFTLKLAGVGGAMVPGTVAYIAGANSATFAPTANLLPNTVYTAEIDTGAQSAYGNNLSSNRIWSFTTGTTVDATAPTVLVTAPVSGAAAVPTNQIITAAFSEAMDPATITAPGTFTVAVFGGGANVPGTVGYAGTTATFTPTTPLAPNSHFTATITVAAKDLAGNPLAAGVVPNPWSFSTGAGPDATPPTITLTNPANVAPNIPVNTTVSATFSEAMNPLSITATGTFTLAVAGVGGAAVPGVVTYNAAADMATFTPTAPLAPNSEYTATISTAATDLGGNPLAPGVAPNPWSFFTGVSGAPVGPALGVASTFGAFGGGAGITNTGINTVINGDLGTTAASTTVTGFHDAGVGCTYIETPSNIGTVNGLIYTAPPPPTGACPSEGTTTTFNIATAAATAATAAYINLSPASRPGGSDPGAGQLGGLTLPPGTYQAASGSFLLTGSDLTLDAQGNANAVWVFQMASSLTVGAPGFPRNIILINGAQAANVYWQVGSQATINPGGGGTMVGTIIASAGVVFSTVGSANITTLDGRALSLVASVTMVNTVVNVP
ncbi:MAG: Ig-like domain-containing protein [Candidatus Acidiferrales bacterium]